jgi:lysophospholipase L1-like esterase
VKVLTGGRRSAVVWLAAVSALVLLWTLTSGSDVDGALWRTYTAATAAANLLASAVIIAVAYVWSAGRGARIRLLRVALVAGAVSLTLGLLEIPVITLGYDYGYALGTHANDTWLQLATGVNRRDDELLHVHQPHSRYVGAVAGNLTRLGIPAHPLYPIDVAYDRNGFRNSEDVEQADVVAIGDSFVEGAEMAQDRTVVAKIAEGLQTTAANLGQSNYGPQQELAVLRRFGVGLSPKVVVWFFFGGNDMQDAGVYDWRRTHLDDFLKARSVSSRSFARNALKAVARLTTTPRRFESSTAKLHRIELRRATGERETLYLDTGEPPWTPRQWNLVSATLLGARDVSRQAGADLLVVYIPRKFRAYLGFVQAEPNGFIHSWADEKLPAVLDAWCQTNDIPFLDSTASLRQAVASGRSVYLPDDVHWNAAGHEVVGAAVVEKIRAMGSLVDSQTGGQP